VTNQKSITKHKPDKSRAKSASPDTTDTTFLPLDSPTTKGLFHTPLMTACTKSDHSCAKSASPHTLGVTFQERWKTKPLSKVLEDALDIKVSRDTLNHTHTRQHSYYLYISIYPKHSKSHTNEIFILLLLSIIFLIFNEQCSLQCLRSPDFRHYKRRNGRLLLRM